MPSRKQDRSYDRRGSLNACSVCSELIKPDQKEIEIEFRLHGAPPHYYHLHVRCMAAWEFERTKLAQVLRSASSRERRPLHAELLASSWLGRSTRYFMLFF